MSSAPPALLQLRHYCHECGQVVGANVGVDAEVHCARCNGLFVEEMDATNPPPLPPAAPAVGLPGFGLNPFGGPVQHVLQLDIIGPPQGGGIPFLQSLNNMFGQLGLQFGAGDLAGLMGSPGMGGDYVNNPQAFQQILNTLLAQSGRQGPPPASRSFLEALPIVTVDEEYLRSRGDVEPEQCAVCWDPFAVGQETARLPCNHAFHKDCVFPWLREHNTCPVCRHQLPTDGHAPVQTGPLSTTAEAIRCHHHRVLLHPHGAPWVCDVCRNAGFGHRYRCTEGCDYDACEPCLEMMRLPPGSEPPATPPAPAPGTGPPGFGGPPPGFGGAPGFTGPQFFGFPRFGPMFPRGDLPPR